MTITIEGRKVKIPRVRLLTYTDYAKLTPPDSGKYALLHGKIIHMPSPNVYHQEICLEIAFQLKTFLKKNPIGKVIISPMDVVFNTHNTLQPDVLFISNQRFDILSDTCVKGAPDLVVEVKSEGNTAAEMSQKKAIYEASGVHEYWLVLPEKGLVRQYQNEDGEFMLRHELKKGDTLHAFVVEGFILAISDILS